MAIKLFLEWSKQEFPTGNPIPTSITAIPKGFSEPDKLLTAPEVDKILNISKGMAYSMMQREEIPTVRMGARIVRVRSKDLDAFINRGKS